MSGPITVDTATSGEAAKAVSAKAMDNSKFRPVTWKPTVTDLSIDNLIPKQAESVPTKNNVKKKSASGTII